MFNRKSTKDTSARSLVANTQNQKSDIATTTQRKLQNFKGLETIADEGVVLVGKGTHIVGEIKNCSIVEIQGVLEGAVGAEVVIVRNGGGFQGDFQAEHAEIHGVVEGGVKVHGLLDVRSTANITGDVTYEQLAVEVGAHISGQLETPAILNGANANHQHSTTSQQHQTYAHEQPRDTTMTNGTGVQIDANRNGSMPKLV